jgi:transcriptional regulator with XRE-family HTH domain
MDRFSSTQAIEAPEHLSTVTTTAVLQGFADVTRQRVRELREEAGISQSALGTAMYVAFGWSRETVTKVESGVRKLNLEELLLLAALFQVPALELLLPKEGETLELSAGQYAGAALVRELLLGNGGRLGSGLQVWPAASSLAAGEPTEKPTVIAEALWERRRARSEELERLAASTARQWRKLERHLPGGEIAADEELAFRTFDGGNLLVRRERDGATYALHPDGGVIRVTIERRREIYTHFLNGEATRLKGPPAFPWLN